jgi:hypothetical protein
MKKSDENKLISDDYAVVAKLLAPRLLAFARLARERSMMPPFEVHVTGADDNTVLHAYFTEDLQLRDISGFPGETPLEARFPLAAVITDATGSMTELRIYLDEAVQ